MVIQTFSRQEAREFARVLLSIHSPQEYDITEYPSGAVIWSFPYYNLTVFTLPTKTWIKEPLP